MKSISTYVGPDFAMLCADYHLVYIEKIKDVLKKEQVENLFLNWGNFSYRQYKEKLDFIDIINLVNWIVDNKEFRPKNIFLQSMWREIIDSNIIKIKLSGIYDFSERNDKGKLMKGKDMADVIEMEVATNEDQTVSNALDVADRLGGAVIRLSDNRWIARNIKGEKLDKSFLSRFKNLENSINDAIRDRAYSLWQQRGGNEYDNWVEAEKQTIL